METIDRSLLHEDYREMMKTESHHAHEVIKDKNGTTRWKEDPFVGRLTNKCNIEYIVAGFNSNGNGKNSEIYRELYRKMGFTLSSYWDVFYCDMNNEDADNYKQPATEE